jgi:DNA-binding CsgD family transcriptional regulator
MATATVLDIEIAAGYAGLDDFEAQARHGLQAARRGRELGLDLIAAYGWQHVAAAAYLTGDPDGRAAGAADAARAAAPGNRDIEGLLLALETVLALLANDIDRALERTEASAAALHDSETAPPAHPRACWPLLLALRNRPEAAAAVEELERAGLTVNGGGRAGLGMARAMLVGPEDPVRAAQLALEADTELVTTPLWRHLVRRIAAEAAAADGWPVPAHWMVEAEEWFREHGHRAAATACRALRGDAPAIPPAWAALGITRREADVLEAIIDGCSNKEIAERLYLSVRTVEKHVESLLRKTGCNSRTRLARFAAT